jgi:hypothetical protein
MNALFISNKSHLNAPIPGGVQICTYEFIALFKKAGFEMDFFPIVTTRSFVKRLKIKLGINAYDFYDFDKYMAQMIKKIKEEQIKLIIINQVNLSGFAKLLKNKVNNLKVIVLSHGNESGDYLHEVLDSKYNIFKVFKLGQLIYKEAAYFSNYVDLLVTISDIEKKIGQWLGALNCIYIPRTITEASLDRKPLPNSIGFVGTLNHPPNLLGVELLANELDKLNFCGSMRIVGSPKEIGFKLEKKFKCIKYIGYLSNDELKEEAKLWTIFGNVVFWYSRGVSTKVAQMIGWGVPVITTTAGIRGYEWSDGEMIIADTPTDMAKKIILFFDDDKLQKKLKNEMGKIKKTSPTLEDLSEKIKNEILTTNPH